MGKLGLNVNVHLSNSPFGLRPHGLLTKSPFGLKEQFLKSFYNEGQKC